MWLKYQSECIGILVIKIHTLLTLVLDKIVNKNSSALVVFILTFLSCLAFGLGRCLMFQKFRNMKR